MVFLCFLFNMFFKKTLCLLFYFFLTVFANFNRLVWDNKITILDNLAMQVKEIGDLYYFFNGLLFLENRTIFGHLFKLAKYIIRDEHMLVNWPARPDLADLGRFLTDS